MHRSTTLLRACYEVCRLLVQERDLPALLQGICDRLAGKGGYASSLLVLLDQESGGMLTAETGLGERVTPVMAELRQGHLPECGGRVLRSEVDEIFACTGGECSHCTITGQEPRGQAFCVPLPCSSSLSGFMLLHLPHAVKPQPNESAIVAELAEVIAQALRQLFAFEAVQFREQELQRAEERYELALHASQAGLWDWNIKTGEMYTSQEQGQLLDYREGDDTPGASSRSIHPEDREQVLAVLNEHLSGVTEEYRIEYRVREPDDQWAWFLDRGRVVERDENNMPVRMTGTHQNITLQKRQEEALAAVQRQLHVAVDVERTFLQTVIDSAGDPVMVIDLNFNLLLINQAAAQLVRGSGEVEGMRGQLCHQLFCGSKTPCRDARFPCPVRTIRKRQRPVKLIHNPFHGNNVNNTFELEVSPLRDGQGQLYGIIEVARDITDRLRIEKELRDSQSHLYRLAHHDTLTGLPNRLLFRDRLTQAISKAGRNRTGVAVLFLDLDRFKLINDSLGHDVGDALLVEVAARLQRQCRQSDTVARLGGDEFVFVLEAVGNRKDAAVVAEKVMGALTEPVLAMGHELTITTSIGIALYPDDSREIDSLIKCADVALYAAKEIGRSNFQFYQPGIAPNGHRPQLGQPQFAEALVSGELQLVFLPQYRLAGGELAGLTASLQWDHPTMGFLPASAVLVAAGEVGMSAAVSRWQIEAVCRTLRSWLDMGLPLLPVTIPFSSRQLLDSELVAMVEHALTEHDLPPHLLVLEVQERTLANATGSELEALGRLARRGVRLAIGDAGNGCSFVRLQQVRAERLTIGREAVVGAPADQAAATVVNAVIALGHALGCTVLGDGVDDEEQLAFLRVVHCDFAQGPVLGPACGAKEVHLLPRSLSQGG